jgi:hypothetical protein
VFEREKITLPIGDRIRFTKNVKHRGHKFLNNELRTVVGIDEGKIIFDKGEIIRNGATLHLDLAIAVTSQAKTVDQVIVSVPVRAFSQANEAQFYVSMYRARWAMHVFTDSKVALRDAVTRPSKRLSSWELNRSLLLAVSNPTIDKLSGLFLICYTSSISFAISVSAVAFCMALSYAS